MQVVLSYAVKSNYYNLHSGCAKGLDEPDMTLCGECTQMHFNKPWIRGRSYQYLLSRHNKPK